MVDPSAPILFAGALLIFAAVLLGQLSSRLGAPLLLVFLGLGMLAGSDGIGGIAFEDVEQAHLLGSLALAVILFDGGLRTERKLFRQALRPALALASLGVVITAVVTALAAQEALDLPFEAAMLLGAIVGSTDAAAVFLLLTARGLNLRKRVMATLEAESGLNDPMAVFLVIGLVIAVSAQSSGVAAPGLGAIISDGVLAFIVQLVGGALLGIAAGAILALLVNLLPLALGLYPVVVVAAAVSVFAGAQLLGASGFLAVYLAGLVFGGRRHQGAQAIDRFHDGLSWLAQIGMFLMLGLLVTPSHLLDVAEEATIIAVALMLVGRPLAVTVCLLPFGFTWREVMFIAWVGLRGAVPIFLGTVPVLAGVPNANLFFSVAFVVVLLSLAVQGWTLAPVARLLRLVETGPGDEPEALRLDLPGVTDQGLVVRRVARGSAAEGLAPAALALPESTQLIAVLRAGLILPPARVERLELDDDLVIAAPDEFTDGLDTLFAPRANGLPLEEMRRKVEGVLADRARLARRFAATLGDSFEGLLPRRWLIALGDRLAGTALGLRALWLGLKAQFDPRRVWRLAAGGALFAVAVTTLLLIPIGEHGPLLMPESTQALTAVQAEAGLSTASAGAGMPVPRVFIASLPADWSATPLDDGRREAFLAAMLPLVLAENERIEEQRQRLLAIERSDAQGGLGLRDQAALDLLSRAYGTRYGDYDELKLRIAPVPPSLALAQAIVGSGWGRSRAAVTGNAVFGLRAGSGGLRLVDLAAPETQSLLSQSPTLGAPEVESNASSRPPAETPPSDRFDSLADAVAMYMRHLNTHAAFRGFRTERAALPAAITMAESPAEISPGLRLAGQLGPYTTSGQAYVDLLRRTILGARLDRFDRGTLARVEPIG